MILQGVKPANLESVLSLQGGIKVTSILKKRAREMSHSGKLSRTFEFLRVFGAAEIIQAKFKSCREKSKKS